MMRLYVWTEHEPDYSGGIAFALAHDLYEARRLIREKSDHKIINWGKLKIHTLKNPIAYQITGGS